MKKNTEDSIPICPVCKTKDNVKPTGSELSAFLCDPCGVYFDKNGKKNGEIIVFSPFKSKSDSKRAESDGKESSKITIRFPFSNEDLSENKAVLERLSDLTKIFIREVLSIQHSNCDLSFLNKINEFGVEPAILVDEDTPPRFPTKRLMRYEQVFYPKLPGGLNPRYGEVEGMPDLMPDAFFISENAYIILINIIQRCQKDVVKEIVGDEFEKHIHDICNGMGRPPMPTERETIVMDEADDILFQKVHDELMKEQILSFKEYAFVFYTLGITRGKRRNFFSKVFAGTSVH